MKKIIKILILICFSQTAFSAITIEITQSNAQAVPIAIVPFKHEANIGGFTDIIMRNLKNSGQFKVLEQTKMPSRPSQIDQLKFKEWKRLGVELVLLGKVQHQGSEMSVQFELVDLYQSDNAKTDTNLALKDRLIRQFSKSAMLAQKFVVDYKKKRQLAHKVSDIVYEKITGERGIFSTKIVYVAVEEVANSKFEYRLEISDADGFNGKTLLKSTQPILSPDWSPDGKKLTYVSFENRKPEVYIQELISGKRLKIAGFKGINSAPAWSPNGRFLSMSLSKDGNPEIYIYDISNNKFERITRNNSIDTEPNWSPDGNSLIFTSDRGGSPQVYKYDISSRNTQRITYSGKYNARARFTPDGSRIIMVHRIENKYHIASQDIGTGAIFVLTSTPSDESPSVSPNGSMVLYATRHGNAGVLSAISMDGQVRLRLPSIRGQVKEPAWSPFFKS